MQKMCCLKLKNTKNIACYEIQFTEYIHRQLIFYLYGGILQYVYPYVIFGDFRFLAAAANRN